MSKMKLYPVMLAGTGSDVGKSIIATALCRIFRQDGYKPAPFKAQNMALNSFVTPDGLEIGRAQAVQAEAAGIPCEAEMNPLLLKPQSDHTSQVVLLGKPIGNKDAYDYWRKSAPSGGGRGRFREEVHAAFDRLSERFNPIVMEGAGSIAELNLRDTDLVNMPMARYADARVILVADIDRGGVFASAYGSIMLQDEEDRKRIKGIIVNKFRGDMRLFDEGRRMLEDICQVPVLGVIPYMKDIHIEEEDSVDLPLTPSQGGGMNRQTITEGAELDIIDETKKYNVAHASSLDGRRCQEADVIDETKKNNVAHAPSLGGGRGRLHIAVVRLPYISNFTDFDALEHDPRISVFYTDKADELSQADIIILPGTKSTLNDLRWLHNSGMVESILRAHREGKTILGICGGYQMMGQTIDDPEGIEGPIKHLPGLGLLSIHTTMAREKTTQQVTFLFEGQECHGYEIHQGQSTTDQMVLQEGHCIGTYVHGILDNTPFVDFLLRPFIDRVGARKATFDYQTYKEQQYDLLADHVRQYLDMDRLYEIMQSND